MIRRRERRDTTSPDSSGWGQGRENLSTVQTKFGNVTVDVWAFNFGETNSILSLAADDLLKFVDGFRAGPPDAFASGVFDAVNDGVDVATDPNASPLRALEVGDYLCVTRVVVSACSTDWFNRVIYDRVDTDPNRHGRRVDRRPT